MPPKPKVETAPDLVPDEAIDSDTQAKVEKLASGVDASTPEGAVDLFVQRARLYADAGYFDAATKEYEKAMDAAMQNGLYQLSGELINEAAGMDERRRQTE